MKKPFVLLALFMTSSLALSDGRWQKIRTSADKKVTFYVDIQSIRFDLPYPRAWALVDGKDLHLIDKSKKRFNSATELVEYDCSERRTRSISSTHFSKSMGRGEAVHTSTHPDGKWVYVVPSSIGEAYFELICGSYK